jgi:hypothetical protein
MNYPGFNVDNAHTGLLRNCSHCIHEGFTASGGNRTGVSHLLYDLE